MLGFEFLDFPISCPSALEVKESTVFPPSCWGRTSPWDSLLFGAEVGLSADSEDTGRSWKEGNRDIVIPVYEKDKVSCSVFSALVVLMDER
jgi:hypothetical protein